MQLLQGPPTHISRGGLCVITRMEVFSSSPSAPELPLGGLMPNNDPVQIKNIDGLGPVKSSIITTPYATGRGELYQGSTTGKRNIVLTLGYNPSWEGEQTISSLRQLLYRYLMPEQWTKLRFFSDELPRVDIEGYVESFEPNIFSQDPEVQVSIICPKPDFIEAEATILTGVVDNGAIEKVFEYIGTVATGYELKIVTSVANPSYTGSVTIVTKAPETPQTFEVESVLIDDTKYFKLSSVRNAKKAASIRVVDGDSANLLSYVTPESVWPELNPGQNSVSVGSEENGQVWTLAYFNRFGGL